MWFSKVIPSEICKNYVFQPLGPLMFLGATCNWLLLTPEYYSIPPKYDFFYVQQIYSTHLAINFFPFNATLNAKNTTLYIKIQHLLRHLVADPVHHCRQRSAGNTTGTRKWHPGGTWILMSCVGSPINYETPDNHWEDIQFSRRQPQAMGHSPHTRKIPGQSSGTGWGGGGVGGDMCSIVQLSSKRNFASNAARNSFNRRINLVPAQALPLFIFIQILSFLKTPCQTWLPESMCHPACNADSTIHPWPRDNWGTPEGSRAGTDSLGGLAKGEGGGVTKTHITHWALLPHFFNLGFSSWMFETLQDCTTPSLSRRRVSISLPPEFML